MTSIGKNILIGLSILLPLLLSLQLIVWTLRLIENWLGDLWLAIFPEELYLPGFGIATFLLIALAVGFSSHTVITGKLLKLPGELMERIPLVKNIYGTIKDFLDLMGGNPFSDSSVVWVSLPNSPGRLLGIITKKGRDKKSRLGAMIGEKAVAVFLPMSYQAGGYMIVVPEDCVEATDMEPGEALQLIMSAGLGQRIQTSEELLSQKQDA